MDDSRTTPPQPSVGAIVHFVNESEEHEAAIITHYQGGGVINARAWSKDGEGAALSGIRYSSVPRKGSWHWPEPA